MLTRVLRLVPPAHPDDVHVPRVRHRPEDALVGGADGEDGGDGGHLGREAEATGHGADHPRGRKHSFMENCFFKISLIFYAAKS